MPRSSRLFATLRVLSLAVAATLLVLPSVARAAPGSASPDGVWREAEPLSSAVPGSATYRVLNINADALSAILGRAPSAGAVAAGADVVLTLPARDGAYERFAIQGSPVFSPELSAANPGIQSYVGQGVDDPTLTATFVRTPSGFYAFIRTPEGMIYMEPNGLGNTSQSISYTRRDLGEEPVFECLVKGDDAVQAPRTPAPSQARGDGGLVAPSGATLSTYDLAVTATGAFTTFFDPGGGTMNTLSQIAASVAAVNAIYVPEVAIRFVVICNNVYTTATDPFTDVNNSGTTNGENQTETDANCGGSGGYDIGHVFHRITSGFSGQAPGTACNNANKAMGYSSVPNPVPTTMVWVVDQLSHEMGHQFTADHTFNSNVTGCAGNRVGTSAYEPGSGSTIMSYAAGVRCDYDFPQTNDGYFHGHSFDQITNHRDGGGNCGATSATGNHGQCGGRLHDSSGHSVRADRIGQRRRWRCPHLLLGAVQSG